MFATRNDLNWNVISRDLFVTVDGEEIRVDGKKAQLRDDTNDVLGITSNSYQIFQNSDLKDFVQPLVGEGLLEIVNIGYLGKGNKVFIQAEMVGDYTIAGEDHRGMITLMNSHDGSSALVAGVTDTRVICGNTFSLAMQDMTTRLRHTVRMHDEAARITEVVDFVNSGMRRYAEQAEALSLNRATEVELETVVSAAYQKPVENIRGYNNIRKFFYSGLGNSGSNLYDAVNAVTQYTSHNAMKEEGKRFASVNFGTNAKVNRRAMSAALALV